MVEDDSVSHWIKKLKEGDADAAQKLWGRYSHRLIELARKKLQDSPRRARDEDDVVQSAFKSFCLRAKAGHFPDLRDRDNLWPLLVVLIARKAANQRTHERRRKRGFGRVRTIGVGDSEDLPPEFAEIIADEPSPEDGAHFFAELESLMDSLEDPTLRLILFWKLEERTNEEMARHLDCSLTSIERKMRLIRKRLSNIPLDP
jgi:RNA polymerase sigma factor (sigma-70 family)